MERYQSESLFFVTKQKLNTEKEIWIPPTDNVLNGETLKQVLIMIRIQFFELTL